MSRLLPVQAVALAAAGGLALAALVRAPRAPAVVALACAAALVLALPARRRLTGVALLAAGLGWWWGTARLDALDRSVLRAEIGRAGRGVVVVTGEARAGMYDQRQFARVRSFEGRRVSEPVELELPLGRAPPQGAILELLARVRAPRGPSHGFDERGWLRRQGVHVVLRVDEWRVTGRRGGLGGAGDRLRVWLRHASAPGLAGERRAVLEGVLLGDADGLSADLKRSFRRSGLFHLLAVSGQNVVLLASGMLLLALLLGAPRAWGHGAAVAAILAYVLAVGPQASVIRAAISGVAMSIGWLLGRERDPWHVLLLAAVALLAWSPYALYDPGFQLSFAAVGAIFLFARALEGGLGGYPLPGRVSKTASVSLACSVATAPILWLQFGAVPLLGVVANAVVEPAVGPLLGLAFAAAAVDSVSPSLAATLAWANGWVAAYIAFAARAVAAVPFAQASGRGASLAAAVALVAAAYAWRRWRTSSSRRI